MLRLGEKKKKERKKEKTKKPLDLNRNIDFYHNEMEG